MGCCTPVPDNAMEVPTGFQCQFNGCWVVWLRGKGEGERERERERGRGREGRDIGGGCPMGIPGAKGGGSSGIRNRKQNNPCKPNSLHSTHPSSIIADT